VPGELVSQRAGAVVEVVPRELAEVFGAEVFVPQVPFGRDRVRFGRQRDPQ
jgi:hypothetical protein